MPKKDRTKTNQKSRHVRLITSLIMLALALVSLVILRIHPTTYWIFTMIMAAVDAILCVWMVAYLKHRLKIDLPTNIWQQILHWIGFLAVVYLIAILHSHGAIDKTNAGLFTLVLLALCLYLAGIYVDITFLLVGITLALMAAGIVLIKAHLLLVMLPVTVIIALLIYVVIRQGRTKAIENNRE